MEVLAGWRRHQSPLRSGYGRSPPALELTVSDTLQSFGLPPDGATSGRLWGVLLTLPAMRRRPGAQTLQPMPNRVVPRSNDSSSSARRATPDPSATSPTSSSLPRSRLSDQTYKDDGGPSAEGTDRPAAQRFHLASSERLQAAILGTWRPDLEAICRAARHVAPTSHDERLRAWATVQAKTQLRAPEGPLNIR